jgi:6-phosphogluconolactonase
VDHERWVVEDADAVAATAAEYVARTVRAAVTDRGAFTMAVSGGSSPWAMFARLAHEDLPWEAVSIWQVDERIAPAGDPDRNAVGLHRAIGALPVTVNLMPVEQLVGNGLGGAVAEHELLDAACDEYAATLPEGFDLIHLGIGPDGHTASLVPGDEVLGVVDRPVAVTSTAYQDRRRMTLTYPALGRTDQLLWLITGASKREALAGVLAGDPLYPASLVEAPRSLIVTDRAAHPQDP